MTQATANSAEKERQSQGFKHYGVLKCQALEGQTEREDKKSPHYKIIGKNSQDEEQKFSVVVNVKSIKTPPDLRVFIDSDFKHPITRQLIDVKFGFTEISKAERKPGGIALDFIRGNLFDVQKMKPVPADQEGDNNDINDLLDFYVQQAIKSTEIDIFAFGEPFDKDTGIHNIHMNQGNLGEFAKENGIFQDGAIFFHFRNSDTWVAFFSAFQSQSFHTDDRNGNPLDKEGKPAGDQPEPTPPDERTQTADIKIIAALVNPVGEDKDEEFVLLLNTTSSPVKLKGWSLKDRVKRELPLHGVIQPGTVMTVTFSGERDTDFQLSNKGGIITLLNEKKLKVHGVSYTEEDTKNQGQTLVF